MATDEAARERDKELAELHKEIEDVKARYIEECKERDIKPFENVCIGDWIAKDLQRKLCRKDPDADAQTAKESSPLAQRAPRTELGNLEVYQDPDPASPRLLVCLAFLMMSVAPLPFEPMAVRLAQTILSLGSILGCIFPVGSSEGDAVCCDDDATDDFVEHKLD